MPLGRAGIYLDMLQPHQLQILNDVWGFDGLRPHQEPVIDHVLENASALILMPTGGGKSLCYQLPGMLQPGLTLVVSPLIALMQDQVDDLRTRGVTAAFLNSTLSYDEQRKVLTQIARKELKFLYAAPERLAANEFEFLKWLAGQGVARVAIDEAHCISSWGHSFRPEYTQLNRLREFLPDTPVVALTATADARTKQDIVDQLHLGGARQFVYSFDRPNIHYSVVPRRREKEQVLAYIKGQGNACGIVYCLSRKKTEEIAEFLQTHGISAAAYHAGIPADVKAKRQAQFKNDQLQVVVATIAFGMGIDKPDVRFVVHLNMPKNIESYYQETGRAGRDGEASEAILFAKGGDFSQLVRFLEDEPPEQQSILLNKLRRMADFTDAHTCRRKMLLQYFGETGVPDTCGNCDNCVNPSERWDATEAAQKFLSTVARLKDRFGLVYIVAILRGSRSQKIAESHRSLSTFGVRREFNRSTWREIGKQLVQLGYVDQTIGAYPVLELNERSWKVLRGEETVELIRFETPVDAPEYDEGSEGTGAAAAGGAAAGGGRKASAAWTGDTELYEKLRTKRLEIAQNLGVPAFVVLTNKSLQALCDVQPANEQELLRVHGFGKAKVTRFGRDFLRVIAGD